MKNGHHGHADRHRHAHVHLDPGHLDYGRAFAIGAALNITYVAGEAVAGIVSGSLSLLADADKKVADAFGVLQEKNMYGKKVMGIVRTTFIIGPDGKIQHIFPKVKAEGHAEEVLAYLKETGKGAA